MSLSLAGAETSASESEEKPVVRKKPAVKNPTTKTGSIAHDTKQQQQTPDSTKVSPLLRTGPGQTLDVLSADDSEPVSPQNPRTLFHTPPLNKDRLRRRDPDTATTVCLAISVTKEAEDPRTLSSTSSKSPNLQIQEHRTPSTTNANKDKPARDTFKKALAKNKPSKSMKATPRAKNARPAMKKATPSKPMKAPAKPKNATTMIMATPTKTMKAQAQATKASPAKTVKATPSKNMKARPKSKNQNATPAKTTKATPRKRAQSNNRPARTPARTPATPSRSKSACPPKKAMKASPAKSMKAMKAVMKSMKKKQGEHVSSERKRVYSNAYHRVYKNGKGGTVEKALYCNC